MKFLVVGLGPSGAILSAHIARAGHTVCGLDIWPEHTAAISEHGLRIEGVDHLHTHLHRVWNSPHEVEDLGFDYVVIAVKTPYLAQVVDQVSALSGAYEVVALQNGLDNEEYLARYFGPERVIRVVINYAGNVVQPGLIEMTFFHKPNNVGCLCGKKDCGHVSQLAGLLTEAGLDSEACNDIKRCTWRKAILNASLSPLSALLDMTMAQVMDCGETLRLVEAMLKESIVVAQAAGYDYGPEFYDFCLEYLARGGHHYPSMAVDMQSGRPTEIDYINGKIVYYGLQLNVPVPVNFTLTSLVKAREHAKHHFQVEQ